MFSYVRLIAFPDITLMTNGMKTRFLQRRDITESAEKSKNRVSTRELSYSGYPELRPKRYKDEKTNKFNSSSNFSIISEGVIWQRSFFTFSYFRSNVREFVHNVVYCAFIQNGRRYLVHHECIESHFVH